MSSGSRLTRARGLKLHRLRLLIHPVLVAPHAGAWIETCSFSPRSRANRGAWIETLLLLNNTLEGAGRASRGRVD
jgi:hypothetical protein